MPPRTVAHWPRRRGAGRAEWPGGGKRPAASGGRQQAAAKLPRFPDMLQACADQTVQSHGAESHQLVLCRGHRHIELAERVPGSLHCGEQVFDLDEGWRQLVACSGFISARQGISSAELFPAGSKSQKRSIRGLGINPQNQIVSLGTCHTALVSTERGSVLQLGALHSLFAIPR